MKHGFVSLLIADTRPLRFAIGYCAVMFAIGLATLATNHSGAYIFMKQYASLPMWAVAFGTYGLARIVSSVRELPHHVSHAVILLGLYLWVFTFVSFIENPIRRFGAADLMITCLILMEVWVAADTCSKEKE